jgi:DNA-binding response OmpR family regulator
MGIRKVNGTVRETSRKDRGVCMATAPNRKKVVIVEDDSDLLEMELLFLGEEGYDVVGVVDGRQAVPTVKAEGADVLLLDFMLPGKDANEILDELQSDPDTGNLPVIVVSAFLERLRSSPQLRKSIAKPFAFDELVKAVHEVVDGRDTT